MADALLLQYRVGIKNNLDRKFGDGGGGLKEK